MRVTKTEAIVEDGRNLWRCPCGESVGSKLKPIECPKCGKEMAYWKTVFRRDK